MRIPFLHRRRPPAPAVPAVPPLRLEPRVSAAPRAAPAARSATDAARSWRAARPDRLVGGFETWAWSTPAMVARNDLRGLIGHARHAARNFDHARAYEMLVRRHVIGEEGIRPTFDVRREDGSPDLADTATARALWVDWGRLGNPTICGRYSWHDLERLTVTHVAREGGQFFRRHYGRGKYGYQLEPLPLDLLDLDLYQPTPGGGYIEAGLEFDADGRLAAGWFWTIAGDHGHRPGRRERRRYPASDLLYVEVPEEFHLALGLPRSQTALRMMNAAEQFEEAAMAAADQGARHSLIWTQPGGADLSAAVDAEDAPERLEPGTSTLAPPGVEPHWSEARFPDAAIEAFMRHFDRGEASGLGVAPETLTGDYGAANYATLHVGKWEEREEWRLLQRAMAERFHDVVWRDLCRMAILAGAVPWPMRKLEKFADAVRWRGRGWQAVDPVKQATADNTGLINGSVTLTEIAARKGRTIEELASERAADRAAFTALGLPDPYTAISPAPATPAGLEANLAASGN